MSDAHHIKIDIDGLHQLGLRGVRRASAFMGFALNAAAREDCNDFSLAPQARAAGGASVPVEVIGKNPPPEQIASMKDDFAQWVTACGLREVTEYYGQLLDRVSEFCSIASYHGESVRSDSGYQTENLSVPVFRESYRC